MHYFHFETTARSTTSVEVTEVTEVAPVSATSCSGRSVLEVWRTGRGCDHPWTPAERAPWHADASEDGAPCSGGPQGAEGSQDKASAEMDTLYNGLIWVRWYPDISPRTFPPEELLYISWTKCHKSNFYLGTELFPSIRLPLEQRTCFIKYKGRLDQTQTSYLAQACSSTPVICWVEWWWWPDWLPSNRMGSMTPNQHGAKWSKLLQR